MFIGIAVAVILVALGIGWLIIGDLEEDDSEVSKVAKAAKGPDVEYEPDEPEPEPEPDEPDEPEVAPKPIKKKAPPKRQLTFPQSVIQLKGRIRSKCGKVGKGPVTIDTLVVKTGGQALTPKVKPKGPVGDCALRIVEGWSFPASEKDQNLKTSVRW